MIHVVNSILHLKKIILYDFFLNYKNKENGFVKTEDLENLMDSLDLLTDKE
jgi:hypothetical protein